MFGFRCFSLTYHCRLQCLSVLDRGHLGSCVSELDIHFPLAPRHPVQILSLCFGGVGELRVYIRKTLLFPVQYRLHPILGGFLVNLQRFLFSTQFCLFLSELLIFELFLLFLSLLLFFRNLLFPLHHLLHVLPSLSIFSLLPRQRSPFCFLFRLSVLLRFELFGSSHARFVLSHFLLLDSFLGRLLPLKLLFFRLPLMPPRLIAAPSRLRHCWSWRIVCQTQLIFDDWSLCW
mmetsp:Transcript_37008/g.72664  ORF Transcript_37008/g.72664 Transcript_37008/m.72664 type:complete len:232 (-) Transcript_37008:485-1180(-)